MTLEERIVEHTTGMFARDGVKSVRMDDIAAEMGISKRTIYEVFGDKENLIMACLRYFHARIRQHNEQLTAGAKNLIEEYLIMMNEWDKQVDATYNIMGDVKKFYPKIYDRYFKEHMDEAVTSIKTKLRKAIDQGLLLKDLNINLSITIIGYSIYGIIKKEAILPDGLTERDAFKYVTSYFIRGIATIKGIKMIDEYFERKQAKQTSPQGDN